jgi:hypothetical protein
MKILKIILVLFLCLVVFFGLFVWVVRYSASENEISEFKKKFDLVQIGDSEQKVLSVLGAPDSREIEFRIGQEIGFEEAYAKAKASDSEYYLIWNRGIDCVFTIGINSKGLVSLKELGGT